MPRAALYKHLRFWLLGLALASVGVSSLATAKQLGTGPTCATFFKEPSHFAENARPGAYLDLPSGLTLRIGQLAAYGPSSILYEGYLSSIGDVLVEVHSVDAVLGKNQDGGPHRPPLWTNHEPSAWVYLEGDRYTIAVIPPVRRSGR